jgi:hypothetical protein
MGDWNHNFLTCVWDFTFQFEAFEGSQQDGTAVSDLDHP